LNSRPGVQRSPIPPAPSRISRPPKGANPAPRLRGVAPGAASPCLPMFATWQAPAPHHWNVYRYGSASRANP
jgi:hypothetical protein